MAKKKRKPRPKHYEKSNIAVNATFDELIALAVGKQIEPKKPKKSSK